MWTDGAVEKGFGLGRAHDQPVGIAERTVTTAQRRRGRPLDQGREGGDTNKPAVRIPTGGIGFQ